MPGARLSALLLVTYRFGTHFWVSFPAWPLACFYFMACSVTRYSSQGDLSIMKKQKGFSLIELLIIVAIAIPNLMRSRMAANESSAVGSLRTINTAEVTYSTTYGTGFAPLANLGGADPCTAVAATACLLDSVLSGGTKSGYTITTAAPAALGTQAAPN